MPDSLNRVNKRQIVLIMALMLLVLAACARISGPQGGSAVVFEGNSLYVGTREGTVVVLRPEDGVFLRVFNTFGEDDDRAIYGEPTIVGGKLYVASYEGLLYVFSTSDVGDTTIEPLDTVTVSLDEPIIASPVVEGNLLLVSSSDGFVYAFELNDDKTVRNEPLWKLKTDNRVWSTPVVVDGIVYVSSQDGDVYAADINAEADSSGIIEPLWKFQTDGAVTATPLVLDGRVYIGSFDRNFYSIDAKNGDRGNVEPFSEADNWYWGKAIANGNIIYVPSLDGTLYALNRETLKLIWPIKTDGAIVGSPVIVGNWIAVGSEDGYIWVANKADGEVVFRCNVDDEIRTSLVEHDGVIFFGVDDQSIRALTISDNGRPNAKWAYSTDKGTTEDWVCLGSKSPP